MILQLDLMFSAAHKLPYVKGKCNRLHGHNYMINLVIGGKPRPYTGFKDARKLLTKEIQHPETGMIVDFDRVKKLIEDNYDHKYLNDILDNPTAENLARHIGELLKVEKIQIVKVEVRETPNCIAIWQNEQMILGGRIDANTRSDTKS